MYGIPHTNALHISGTSQLIHGGKFGICCCFICYLSVSQKGTLQVCLDKALISKFPGILILYKVIFVYVVLSCCVDCGVFPLATMLSECHRQFCFVLLSSIFIVQLKSMSITRLWKDGQTEGQTVISETMRPDLK